MWPFNLLDVASAALDFFFLGMPACCNRWRKAYLCQSRWELNVVCFLAQPIWSHVEFRSSLLYSGFIFLRGIVSQADYDLYLKLLLWEGCNKTGIFIFVLRLLAQLIGCKLSLPWRPISVKILAEQPVSDISQDVRDNSLSRICSLVEEYRCTYCESKVHLYASNPMFISFI